MSTDTYINLLYKKSQGAAFTNPLTSPMEEAVGSSAITIKPSQIWNQEIPTTEPACQAATALPEGIDYGTQSIAVGFSWIIKYTSVWLSDAPSIKRSFYYKGTTSNVLASNILIGAIPPGQTSSGRTYKITVYSSSDGATKTPIDSKYWYFDRNSGYLTFLSSVTYPYVYMDFWRYTGTTGYSSGSGSGFSSGSSSGSISPTGPTGANGSKGFTGPTGPNSPLVALQGALGEIGPTGPIGSCANILSYFIVPIWSNVLTYLCNITIPAYSTLYLEFLPTSFGTKWSFDTNWDPNTLYNIKFSIVDSVFPETFPAYDLYSVANFTPTNMKTVAFQKTIVNETPNNRQGVVCVLGLLLNNNLLTQVTQGYINVQTSQFQTSGYDNTCLHVVNSTGAKNVYNSKKTNVFTITPLATPNYGVINVWGTPKKFCQISGVVLGTLGIGFKYIPASDGGMYIYYLANSASNIYSASTITYTTDANTNDSVVVKYDRSGTASWYARLFATSTTENPSGICVDAAHNVYLVGSSSSSTALDINTKLTPTGAITATTVYTSQIGSTIGYIVKISSAGAYLDHARITTTATYSVWLYVCCYSHINDVVYCGGAATGTLSIYTLNNKTSSGWPFSTANLDAYIVKMDNAGNQNPWLRRVASTGTNNDRTTSVDCDSTGNVIAMVEVVGSSNVYSMPIDVWTSIKAFTNGASTVLYHIIVKFSSAGDLIWATNITYSNMVSMVGTMAVSNDEVYVQFRTTSNISFKSTDLTSATVSNATTRQFLAKYDSAGVYKWCINIIRGTSAVYFTTLRTAPSGNVYMEFTFAGIVSITDTSLIVQTVGIATSVGSMLLCVTSTGIANVICYHDVN